MHKSSLWFAKIAEIVLGLPKLQAASLWRNFWIILAPGFNRRYVDSVSSYTLAPFGQRSLQRSSFKLMTINNLSFGLLKVF